MAGLPEPHRDQKTIGSFKRTINAALLLLVAGWASRPPPRRFGLVVAAVAGAGAVATGHDPGTLLQALSP